MASHYILIGFLSGFNNIWNAIKYFSYLSVIIN